MMEASSADECAAVADYLGWDYRLDSDGWDPYGWVLEPEEISGTEPNQADPNLRPTYADQLILAFERQVGARSAIELTFIEKRTRDITETTCRGNWPVPSADAECDYYIFANIPELMRDFRGVTLTFETRKYPWMTLLASYTYSISKGSIEYSQGGTRMVDVYPWHYDNIYGYLWDHQKHRLKLNGFFNVRGDWNFAFDARWFSPYTWAPWEDRGDNLEIPGGIHFLEPRGSREANSEFQLDLQLSKGFTTGRVRFVLIGSVLNALNTERPWGVCEQISGCGFDENDNPMDMGDPILWQTPRRYEVGFRVEF
jgi:outer membrane receptor protein involved in Fe transport